MPKSISTFSLNFVLSQTFWNFKNIREKFHFHYILLLLIPQCFQIISKMEQEMLKYCQPGFLIEFQSKQKSHKETTFIVSQRSVGSLNRGLDFELLFKTIPKSPELIYNVI